MADKQSRKELMKALRCGADVGRMLRLNWTELKMNNHILNELGEPSKILRSIKERR